MTPQKAEQMFLRDLKSAIDHAREHGVAGDTIAHDLRSIASDVSKQWNAELDRCNAEHIAQLHSKLA
jgi:hypothetical protein